MSVERVKLLSYPLITIATITSLVSNVINFTT